MTTRTTIVTVNGAPADAGCYVDGHLGEYGPDHLADQLEGFAITIPRHDDPRRARKVADFTEDRGWAIAEHAADVHSEVANSYALIDLANGVTTGGYWEWWEGEVYLRSYVCSECGRDARDPAQTTQATDALDSNGPCDWCCDADDPGCFAQD